MLQLLDIAVFCHQRCYCVHPLPLIEEISAHLASVQTEELLQWYAWCSYRHLLVYIALLALQILEHLILLICRRVQPIFQFFNLLIELQLVVFLNLLNYRAPEFVCGRGEVFFVLVM